MVLALLLGGLLAAPGAWAAPPRILIVGDSISQGSASDYTWRYDLYRHLSTSVSGGVDFVGDHRGVYDNVAGQQAGSLYADPNFDQDHHAWWGRSILAETGFRLNPDTLKIEDTGQRPLVDVIKATSPDVMLVLLGTNDLAWLTGPERAAQDMATLVAQARAAYRSVRGRAGLKIAIGLVPGRVDVWGTPDSSGNKPPIQKAQIDDLNARLAKMQTSTSVTEPIQIAPSNAGWNATRDTWDGTHPNDMGEDRIAWAFSGALQQLGIGTKAYPNPRAVSNWDVHPTTLTATKLATTPGAVPSIDAFGTADDGTFDRQGVVRWGAAANATGYLVTYYDLEDSLHQTTLPYAVGGTSFGLGYLPKGHVYETAVTPVNDGKGVRLNWSSVPGSTGYTIWQRDATANQAWSPLPVPVNALTWTAKGMIPDHRYEWSIVPSKGTMSGTFAQPVTEVDRATGTRKGWGEFRTHWLANARKSAVDFERAHQSDSDAAYIARYGYGSPDCAHFASEALLQAGYPEYTKPLYQYDDTKVWVRNEKDRPATFVRWYNGERNSSLSFTVSNSLEPHLRYRESLGKAHRVSDPRMLEYGDLMIVNERTNGEWNHTVMVTGFDSNGVPLYTQHSDSRGFSYPFANIRAAAPDYIWEFWHLDELG